MCYFVTIGTRESQLYVETLLGDGALLGLIPSKNLAMKSVFPREDHLFEVLCGQCTCSLVMREDTQPSVEQQRARLRAKYEIKGWSEATIVRAP